MSYCIHVLVVIHVYMYMYVLYAFFFNMYLLCFFSSHKDFNSHEVGQKLAATILTKLDPTALPQSDTPTSLSGKKLIPTYTQPKLTYTYLPGK